LPPSSSWPRPSPSGFGAVSGFWSRPHDAGRDPFAHRQLAVSRRRLPAMPPGRPNVRQQWPKPSPHFRRLDIIRIEMLMLISVSTAGCATVPRLKNDCDWAQPIRPSRKYALTQQTKEQIAAHNESGARICKWRECSTTSEVAQYLHETLRLIKQY
jgi:hypothetical protein